MRIKTIQLFLLRLGYNCGEANGIFGTATQNALNEFQRDHNLPATPGIDNLTSDILESEAKRKGFRLI